MQKQFIEIGSNDFDTCLPLARNGWKGVMIEPILEIYKNIAPEAEKCGVKALNLAVTDYDGEIDFAVPFLDASAGRHPAQRWVRGIGHVISENHKGMNNIGLLQSPEGRKHLMKTIKIPCKKLDTIIEDSNIKHIDYLKIDVEGHELNIIDAYSWRLIPTFIKIEHEHLDDEGKGRLQNILIGRGYVTYKEKHDIYGIY
jgi:FkbM family methyltransferase